jgi:hypothetical protein
MQISLQARISSLASHFLGFVSASNNMPHLSDSSISHAPHPLSQWACSLMLEQIFYVLFQEIIERKIVGPSPPTIAQFVFYDSQPVVIIYCFAFVSK